MKLAARLVYKEGAVVRGIWCGRKPLTPLYFVHDVLNCICAEIPAYICVHHLKATLLQVTLLSLEYLLEL